MSTVTEYCPGKLIEMLGADILADAQVENLSDTTTILLSPENYRLLISSSELMSYVFKRINETQKNNFIVYPLLKDINV